MCWSIRATALGLLVAVGAPLLPPASAGAQVPAPEVVCVRTVGDASLDDTLPLAGRSRSLADEDGRVVARELQCPYARDQRVALRVIVTWRVARSSTSPVGTVGCRDDGYVIDDGGRTGTLPAPSRQAAVVAAGDVDLVGEARAAAALYLDVVGEGALGCRPGDRAAAVGSPGSGWPSGALAVPIVALVGLGAWVVARRRRRQVPALGADEGHMAPDDALAHLRGWIALDGLELVSDDAHRLVVRIDARPPLDVAVVVGEGHAEPIRLLAEIVPDGGTHLDRVDLEALVEEAVLRRSALVDARLAGRGAVEVVVVIYPDGLSRHAFHAALFECQKLRDCIALDVRRAVPVLHER